MNAEITTLVQDPHKLVRDALRATITLIPGLVVVAEASTPDEAVATATKASPDLVLLDMSREAEAMKAFRTLRTTCPASRVICLADAPTDDAVNEVVASGGGIAMKSGRPEDFTSALDLTLAGKPGVAPEFVGPVLSRYLEIIQERSRRDAALVEALADAMEKRDPFTAGHIARVSSLANTIACELDPSLGQNQQLRYGYLLHDVGKGQIPDSILLKTGNLAADEWDLVKLHPEAGLDVVSPLGLGHATEEVVLHHHERWDGTGYPEGLKKEKIPIGARIFAVADTFDALTSDRPWRRAVSHHQALDALRQTAGTHLDPGVVHITERLLAQGRWSAEAPKPQSIGNH